MRKQSSFLLLEPRSKYWPQVSSRVHTRRMRNRCSGGSSELGLPSWLIPKEMKEKRVRKMTADSTMR